MHRVPWGEYVPLKDWLPFMSWFTPYDFDYGIQQGEKFTRFPLAGKYQFGVLICYEDTDPFLAREYVRPSEDGPAVDFLVNISNDGWFDGSAEHEEHLAVSRFRAIECRRAMVRAVNMGISAVIDGNGRVLKPRPLLGMATPVWVVPGRDWDRVEELPVSQWHQFKKVAGVLKAAVPIDGRFSFYAYAGDWLPIGCWAAPLFLSPADSPSCVAVGRPCVMNQPAASPRVGVVHKPWLRKLDCYAAAVGYGGIAADDGVPGKSPGLPSLPGRRDALACQAES